VSTASAFRQEVLETRSSHGLEQFCSSLDEREGMTILDLAGANQNTVTFLANYGHRLYSDDLLAQMEEYFGDGDFYENQRDPIKAARFLKGALTFPQEKFDGVLVWDRLQFLAPPLLEAVITRLRAALRPGSSLLAVFHADQISGTIPAYIYKISDTRTLTLSPRERRKPSQSFNNRSLERLFQDFQSVKFFLTRDHLREVIVRR
jgi:hypothetical protein